MEEQKVYIVLDNEIGDRGEHDPIIVYVASTLEDAQRVVAEKVDPHGDYQGRWYREEGNWYFCIGGRDCCDIRVQPVPVGVLLTQDWQDA